MKYSELKGKEKDIIKEIAKYIVDKWVDYINEAIENKKHPPFDKVIAPFLLSKLREAREETIEVFRKQLNTYPAIVSLIEKVREDLEEA